MRLEVYQRILDGVDDGIYFLDPDRRITFWNKGAERLSGYTSKEVVGMHCADNILVHTDKDGVMLCTCGCPVTKTLLDGQTRENDIFMHHKDGHRIPVTVNVSPVRGGHGNIVGAVEIFRKTRSDNTDRLIIEDLKKIALLDPLTELPNRRSFDTRLNLCFAELRRHAIPFGLVFCDINYFKNFNDIYGHGVGDEVLKMVANTLRMNLRVTDFVGRWGGDEFMILVTHAGPKRILEVSEKLRTLVGNCFITIKGRPVGVTVTLGCTSAKEEDTAESIVERVDRLLYRGKEEGRGCVVSDFGKLAA